ncbi:hypothetical protein [Paenarthrobacter sp. Y-19]|uniref:hypothetical protein n=1 Tax=Paenarthrobacter sp. Y-19 TaxID=3031125 RepID=UPI0023DAA31C|nr:hypothetical protein [Paenarthrobacter sp. Y-19]
MTDPSTTVEGVSLANYNRGLVVPLYTANGVAPSGGDATVPLCGVRYATEAEGGPANGGPVSAWMYCTDPELHSCIDGRPLHDDVDKNSGMTDFQRRAFAYIVQNGFQYTSGTESVFVTSDTDSESRYRVQQLAWCVADYNNLREYAQSICDESKLGPNDIEKTLDFLAVPYVPELSISPATQGPLSVGDQAKVTLKTNVAGTPINLSASTGNVTLCPDETDATLRGNLLTVDTQPVVGDSVDVDLCVTVDQPGTLKLSASVVPATDDSLNWFHNGDTDCQVFAVFNHVDSKVINASATVTVDEIPVTPTPTPTPSPSETKPVETPTPTPSPSETKPVETPTPTPSPSETKPVETPTPTPSPSETKPVETPTPTPTPSETKPVETPTPTPSPSETKPVETPTPSPSETKPVETPPATSTPSATTPPSSTPSETTPAVAPSEDSCEEIPGVAGNGTSNSGVCADRSVNEGSDENLASTGAQATPYVAIAAVLVLFGLVLMLVTRRKAASRHS